MSKFCIINVDDRLYIDVQSKIGLMTMIDRAPDTEATIKTFAKVLSELPLRAWGMTLKIVVFD